MKIRKGFVSNSSSSSFCIFGVALDEQEIIEIAKKKFDSNVGDGYDAGEIIEEKTELSHHSCYDSNWIGKSWSSIKDDQTGKQFKDEIEAKIKELGIDKKCSTHEEAWFD